MGRSIAVQRGTLSGESEEASYSGDPAPCDGCGRPLADERFFADAMLPARGHAWGLLCAVCTQVEGVRPGWGRAQFYERIDIEAEHGVSRTHHWRCVAGGPPRGAIEA